MRHRAAGLRGDPLTLILAHSNDTRFSEAVDGLGGVDCLINAAEALLDRSLWNTTDADLLALLDINLAGSFRSMRVQL